MRAVSYKLIKHKGKNRIAVYFAFDYNWNKRMEQVEGAKWSNTLKCWHIPDTNINRRLCKIQGDTDEIVVRHNDVSIQQRLMQVSKKIKLKGYSTSTSRNYGLHLKEFFSVLAVKYNIEEINQSIIEDHLLLRMEKKNSSESDMNCHINAIKFYYEQVLNRERMLFNLPRPVKPLQLPKVLSENELERLFRSLPNIKHKGILVTAFSCGV